MTGMVRRSVGRPPLDYDPVQAKFKLHPKVDETIDELAAARKMTRSALISALAAAAAGTTVQDLTKPDDQEVLPASA
jgi:hypothetical protein